MSTAGRPTVYVETTIVSYLTARRSRDFIVRAHQELTRKWWHSRRDRYRLVISARVIDEAQRGNRAEAKKRLRLLRNYLKMGTGSGFLLKNPALVYRPRCLSPF